MRGPLHRIKDRLLLWWFKLKGVVPANFDGKVYIEINPDVADAGLDPLIHYLTWGRWQGRPTTWSEARREPIFPDGAVAVERTFSEISNSARRVAVFAAYSGDGRIEPYVVEYLKGLKEVSDAIIFVCDAPLFPEELSKLDGLVVRAVARRHGQYDFRSYAMGIDLFRKSGALAFSEELVLCNDSCYGPFISFKEQFDVMAKREGDFWGMTQMRSGDGMNFVQSYFCVFRKRLLGSAAFADFWNACLLDDLPVPVRVNTVAKREMRMTEEFVRAGFSYETWVPFVAGVNMSYQAAQTLTKWHMPLVKIKCHGDRILSYDRPNDVVDAMLRVNPAMAAIVIPHFKSALGKRSGVHA